MSQSPFVPQLSRPRIPHLLSPIRWPQRNSEPALLISEFRAKRLRIASQATSPDRYLAWLPLRRRIPDAGCTVTDFSKPPRQSWPASNEDQRS
jgi:hypothetical protein